MRSNEGFEIESESDFQNETLDIKSKQLIKLKTENLHKEKILRGKTLQVYWYILTHKYAGVREIQKALSISSPGTVSYQIKKLVDANIISKNEKDGKYYANESLKKGVLGFYIRIGFLMIPRFSLYLVIYILGFIGYFVFAFVYGDNFITNPGSLLLLFFLIFGIAIFIFESIKIWKRKPTKFNLN